MTAQGGHVVLREKARCPRNRGLDAEKTNLEAGALGDSVKGCGEASVERGDAARPSWCGVSRATARG
jgi:hypothetical protein